MHAHTFRRYLAADHHAVSSRRKSTTRRSRGSRALADAASRGCRRSDDREACSRRARTGPGVRDAGDAVPDRPIVVGLTASTTHATAARARELAALRPDGLLVTPPVYVRPTQDGIRRHVEAIVDAADLPVLVYNIPYRTGVNVELDTLQALARDPRVAGIKECGGTLDRMSRLVHDTPLAVLSGDDNQNFAALCAGAHGTIASSAHVLPEWHVRIHALLRDGRLADARRMSAALQPLVAALFAEPNPAPVKAVLAAQAWCENELRLPFVPASDGLCATLAQLCAELDAHAPAAALA
ncbi:Dihydrodipicolinate synthase/N-acetylneuraminate lyase [Burkholderia dolosa AU0158]|nr:Dihydrodipicolinate synthase/N-acetylneuraminate lyase [Burkholderia dolosa AU0158]